MLREIDLNADVGEFVDSACDQQLLRLVSSVNISCGIHAGSPDVTLSTLSMAVRAGVRIGAHPGMAGEFGRSSEKIEPTEAFRSISDQLSEFLLAASKVGAVVSYVKPHGSLYNQAEQNGEIAESIIEAVLRSRSSLALMGLGGGRLTAAARQRGLAVIDEFFADRAYLSSGQLSPRAMTGAVIHDHSASVRRVVGVCASGHVDAIDGVVIPVQFQSICVHGDTPDSVAMAAAIRSALTGRGITIRPTSRVSR